MIAPANTLVRILRGTTRNFADDEVDADTPVYENVPAFIVESSRSSTNSGDLIVRSVRRVVGRFDARVDIQLGDRVEDQTSGTIYTVENVSRPRPGMFEADQRVDLKNVD